MNHSNSCWRGTPFLGFAKHHYDLTSGKKFNLSPGLRGYKMKYLEMRFKRKIMQNSLLEGKIFLNSSKVSKFLIFTSASVKNVELQVYEMIKVKYKTQILTNSFVYPFIWCILILLYIYCSLDMILEIITPVILLYLRYFLHPIESDTLNILPVLSIRNQVA